jgi:hypothetical protein
MVPDKADILVRMKSGDSVAVYLIGTFAMPEQFLLQSRDEAVSQALAFARQRHVRAWFNSDEMFVLLGNYGDIGTELTDAIPSSGKR